jgi:peptidoglycan-N-acetylglucosamine deacetylase
MDRRVLLSLLGVGAAQALVGCSAGNPQVNRPGASAIPRVAPHEPVTWTSATPTARPLPAVPAPHPGPPTVIFKAPRPTRQVALTIDDGYSPETVAGYVAFAQRSKIPITFSPNGAYRSIWDRHADTLRPLIEAGQVQIGNHTWTHRNLLGRPDAAIRADVEKNEEWIQQTFGITSRPWFRPPYGSHNSHVDGLLGELGYTKILLWNGSFGDSTLLTPEQLLGLASRYLQPGTIMLGHANHQTVIGLFGQIEKLINDRHLQPVTLDTMFGTSRAAG